MGLTRSVTPATLALLLHLLLSGLALPFVCAQDAGTSISLEELATLSETQRALVEARELAAKLDEPRALARLLAAERALREILHVPGVHAWLAEVWLALALVAAQRGELDLADSWFAQALTLDPTRHVGAAEAAPPVIARSRAVARTRDAAQRSRFRIEPYPDNATCWVDGRLRGAGSIEVDLAPGLHLLLLQAEGFRPYAALVDALSGTRRPFVLTLSPTQRTLTPSLPLAQTPTPTLEELATRSDTRATPATNDGEKKRWWKRWPLWVSAASVAVAGGIAIGFATRDERTVQRRTLSIDPGATEP